MCLGVYVACDRALPTHTTDNGARSFRLRALSPEEEIVRKQFTLPYLYYACSHYGCSCGFEFFDRDDQNFDLDAYELARRDYAAMREALEPTLKSGGAIEIFVCWEGGQERPRPAVEEVRLDDFTNPHFRFQDPQFIKIV